MCDCRDVECFFLVGRFSMLLSSIGSPSWFVVGGVFGLSILVPCIFLLIDLASFISAFDVGS